MPGLQPVHHRYVVRFIVVELFMLCTDQLRSYMLRNTKARSMARKHKPQNLQLPAELLHIIVSHVVGDYLDDLIVGPLSIPLADLATIRADMARFGLSPSGNAMAPNVARTNEVKEKEDEFDFFLIKAWKRGILSLLCCKLRFSFDRRLWTCCRVFWG